MLEFTNAKSTPSSRVEGQEYCLYGGSGAASAWAEATYHRQLTQFDETAA